MVKLKRLTIEYSYKRHYPGIAIWLFFSCPTSVEDLCIGESDYIHEYENFNDEEDSDDDSEGSGGQGGQWIGRKSMMLSNLRTLEMLEWPRLLTKEDILLIFEHCPRLEELMERGTARSGVVYQTDEGMFSANLREVYYSGTSEIVGALPENQLEELKVKPSSSGYCLDEVVTGNTLLCHQRTLKEIRITTKVTGAALRVILSECEALEVLEVGGSTIDLSDAVASPWASSRMSCLYLGLHIPQSPSASGTEYIPYYLRMPPDQPSAYDHDIFAQLDIFYRQIGKQKDLTELYFRRLETVWNPLSVISPVFRRTTSVARPLPGLLKLENKSSAGARPGFLQLLGGLTKLTNISGEIFPETSSRKIADDALEADWIAEHWPLLRDPGFLPYSGPEGAMLRRSIEKKTVENESDTEESEDAGESDDDAKDDGSL
jgi:hypothetical protein